MTAVRQDLTVKEGRDITLVFSVDADEGQTLDGADIKFQMARHTGSHVPVVTKELGSGILMTSEELTFEVDILPTDTWGLSGKYYYEVMVTTSGGRQITTSYGYITVEDSLIGEVSE